VREETASPEAFHDPAPAETADAVPDRVADQGTHEREDDDRSEVERAPLHVEPRHEQHDVARDHRPDEC
jgi:hypothetical protein